MNCLKNILAMLLLGVFIICCSDDVNDSTTGGDTDSDSDSDSDMDSDSDSDTDSDTDGDTESDTNTPDSTGECETNEDCILNNDCCQCAAGPAAQPLSCDITTCFVIQCDVLSIDNLEATCVAGRCVMNAGCDDSNVMCFMAEPQCPEGQSAVVNEGGTCWTGSCIPTDQCSAVADCNACTADQECVTYVTQMGNQYHCVQPTEQTNDCNNEVTCECVGKSVCVDPFNSCSESTDGISCGCPTC